MVRTVVLATKLPADLTKSLDEVCSRFGLRKNFVIETALREKLEDLLDTYDLEQAVSESSEFISWDKVKQQHKLG